MSRLLALLPGYNVARHLADLVPRLPAAVAGITVLVVDDGSADGTADAARAIGAELVVHEVNRGKGEALKTGFAWAVAQGFEGVFTLDADGQHLPEEMPRFLEAWEAGAHVVVGSRMDDNENMPWLRKRTNEVTSRVVSGLAGTRIADSQSGYRFFDARVLADLHLESSRYDLESEILIKAGRLGYSIASVPITSVYDDQHSSINPFVDTLRFLRLVGRAQGWIRDAEARRVDAGR